jgi:hypothetical protein
MRRRATSARLAQNSSTTSAEATFSPSARHRRDKKR